MAKLLLRTDAKALTVPSNAVQRGANGLYVYVVKPDNTAELRPVQAARLEQALAVISSGIDEGERVVVSGHLKIQPGAAVNARMADRRPRLREVPRHEHLGTVHPPPDRHVAADGGASAGRASPPTRSCRSRRCRRSTSRPSRFRRSCPAPVPETMARSVAQPLERQFAQISGVSADDLDQRAGQHQIIVQFDLDRNIDAAAQDVQAAINAAGGPVAEEPADPADLPQGQPGRLADPDPAVHVRRPAADRGRRLRREHPGAADRQIAGVAQVIIGGEQKPAMRVQVDPAQARRRWACRWRMSARLAVATVMQPKGSIDGADRSLHDLRQRPAHRGRPPGTTSSSPTATARRSGSATSAAPSTGRRTPSSPAWQNGKRGILLTVFKQPGANVIETVDQHQGGAAAAARRRSRRRCMST